MYYEKVIKIAGIAGVLTVGGYAIFANSKTIEPFDLFDSVYYGMTSDEVEAVLRWKGDTADQA